MVMMRHKGMHQNQHGSNTKGEKKQRLFMSNISYGIGNRMILTLHKGLN